MIPRGILAFLLAVALTAAPVGNGQLILVLPVTDVQLVREIEISARWKHFFLVSGDQAWAAYYAGREAYAIELLQLLYVAHQVPQDK